MIRKMRDVSDQFVLRKVRFKEEANHPGIPVQEPLTDLMAGLQDEVQGGSSDYPDVQSFDGNRSDLSHHRQEVQVHSKMKESGLLSMTIQQLRIYAVELTHQHLALLQETARKERQGDKLVNVLHSLAKHGPAKASMSTVTSLHGNSSKRSSRARVDGSLCCDSISGKRNHDNPPAPVGQQLSPQSPSNCSSNANKTISTVSESEFNFNVYAEKEDWSSSAPASSSSSASSSGDSGSLDSATARRMDDTTPIQNSATLPIPGPSLDVQEKKKILIDKENFKLSSQSCIFAETDTSSNAIHNIDAAVTATSGPSSMPKGPLVFLEKQKGEDKAVMSGAYRDPAIIAQESRQTTPSLDDVHKVLPPVMASLVGEQSNRERPTVKCYLPPSKREDVKNQVPNFQKSAAPAPESRQDQLQYPSGVRKLQIEFAIDKIFLHGAGVLVINQLRTRTYYYTYYESFTTDTDTAAYAEGRSSRKIRNCVTGMKYFQKYFKRGDHIRVYCDDDKIGDATFKPTRCLTEQVEEISGQVGCDIEIFHRPINSFDTLQENKQMLAAVHLASGRRGHCTDVLRTIIGATPAPGTGS